MTSNRIQKLLFSEYSDFEDIVLVESPFAETSRDGKGIRQVQMGLTPSKLILACYCLKAMDEPKGAAECGRDPDIESFELVSAYPVESVNLSVFRHRRRQTLKARFCNGNVNYFELGGWQERKMLWSVWCERIKFLSPYDTRTSASETSVATSSSSSSLFIVRSSLSVSQGGQRTLWCQYATAENKKQTWADPHLYLGPAYMEKGMNSVTLPQMTSGQGRQPIKIEECQRRLSKNSLLLSVEHELLAAEAVELWESQTTRYGQLPRIPRRYGFCAFPHFLSGLGLWHLPKTEAYSLQVKRSVSMVHLPQDELLCSPSLRAQLIRTMSLESLAVPALCPDKLFQLAESEIQPREKLDFWTDEGDSNLLDWRRDHCVRHGFRIQQKHSNTSVSDKSRSIVKRKRCRRSKTTQRSNFSINRDMSNPLVSGDMVTNQSPWSVSWQRNKRTGWRGSGTCARQFSSSCLAHQLTMIDKLLFLQLTTLELSRLRKDMNSWRAPCLRALVSFSYRTSSLVASQIISGHSVKERAVLIVKFVGVAYKCHMLHSLQTAISVLRGLQCPAVYRLQLSWAYVRKHHASKYRWFEDLSRRYLDPRLPLYQRTYDSISRTPPYMTCAELLVAVLLDHLPELPRSSTSSLFTTGCSTECLLHPRKSSQSSQSLGRFLSILSIFPTRSLTSQRSLPDANFCHSDVHLKTVSEEVLLDNLDKFFVPVTTSCPQRRHLQDVQYFLDVHLAAATRYAIPFNPRARAFLLLGRYHPFSKLFELSKQLES